MSTRLGELLSNAGVSDLPQTNDVMVSGVSYDSRRVQPGDLFVAVPGFHVDGTTFATDAVERGAVAVVSTSPIPSLHVPVIVVANPRFALGRVAAELAGHPARKMNVVGITGTDGKTTTTTMLWAAWRACGISAAASTTVEFRLGADVFDNASRSDAPPTTGDAPEVQQRLRQCLEAGCTHVAFETSSHALELHRVEGVEYTGAIYTRITSEHLELHGSLEGYISAKEHLLDLLDPSRDPFAVFDLDDDNTNRFIALAPERYVTYSASGAPAADVRATNIHTAEGRTQFDAETPWGSASFELRIPGRFNVANALAALSGATLSGATFNDAVAGISGLASVNGRMERVDAGQPFTVVVDYAHTADSLEKVLNELRSITSGKLWVVFGSAGERDIDKRPKMGAVAAQLADHIVITDEDPRDEDRMQILEEIAAGATGAGARRDENLHLIPDRPDAIAFAIANAEPDDTVLLAGKGHETSILSAGRSIPFQEREVALAALRNRFGS